MPLSLQFAPSNTHRLPMINGPMIVNVVEAYIAVSNFALLAFAYRVLGQSAPMPISEDLAWLALGTATAHSLACSFASECYLMKVEFRPRWLRHSSPASHFRDFLWGANTHRRFGPSEDDHREYFHSIYPHMS